MYSLSSYSVAVWFLIYGVCILWGPWFGAETSSERFSLTKIHLSCFCRGRLPSMTESSGLLLLCYLYGKFFSSCEFWLVSFSSLGILEPWFIIENSRASVRVFGDFCSSCSSSCFYLSLNGIVAFLSRRLPTCMLLSLADCRSYLEFL